MDSKNNIQHRYVVYVPALFIIGLVLLFWGISMVKKGYTKRENLEHIMDENTLHEKALSEGRYVDLSDYYVYGDRDGNSESFLPNAVVYLYPNEINYYALQIENDNETIAIPLEMDVNLEQRNLFEDSMDIDGHSDYQVLGIIKETDSVAFELMEKVISEHGLNEVPNLTTVMDYKISIVDFDREKEMFIWGLWICLAGLILVIGSQPWKMVRKFEMSPEKSFNYIYEKKFDDSDLRVIGEEAYQLRLRIKVLEERYDIIRKSVWRNGIWCAVFFAICLPQPMFLVPYVLLIIFGVKMLISLIWLMLNWDCKYSRRILHLFYHKPMKEEIRTEQEKLSRCDALIDMMKLPTNM